MSKAYLLLKLEMLSANSEEKTPQTCLNALTQGPEWCCHGGIAQAVGASVSQSAGKRQTVRSQCEAPHSNGERQRGEDRQR